MKTKIYANIVKSGKVIKSACIGSAILDDDRIKARKYNDLMRCARKEFPEKKKGQYITLTTEDGKECDFGGYTCPFPYVRFS